MATSNGGRWGDLGLNRDSVDWDGPRMHEWPEVRAQFSDRFKWRKLRNPLAS